MKNRLVAICSLGAFAISGTANAEITGFGDSEGFTAGLGVVAQWSPYDGADSPSTTPIPYIAYDWENAHLGIDGFSYSFFNSDSLTVSTLLEPRWSFGDPEDSPLFEDIERDTALEAGLEAQVQFGSAYLGGTVLHDISNVHGGFEGIAQAGFGADFGPFELDAAIGSAYRDKDLSLHLYGVKSKEARAGLAAFAPDAAWYPFVQTELFYPIGDSMGAVAFAKYERLDDAAKDSPLISKDHDSTFGFAILKRF